MLPTTPPTTALRVSGARPVGSGVGSTGTGAAAAVAPASVFALSPVPSAANVTVLASVVEVQRELLLLVEANVEREGEVRE